MNDRKDEAVGKPGRIRLIVVMIVTGVVLIGIFLVNTILFQRSYWENIVTRQQNEVRGATAKLNLSLSETVDAVKLASCAINDMLKRGAGNEEILDYISKETVLVNQAFSSEYTGFYGMFGNTYLDGAGWKPDDNYVATERPWYMAALEAQGEVALVTPYVDSSTQTLMMSVSRLLYDKKSVISLDLSMSVIKDLISREVRNNNWDGALLLDADSHIAAYVDPMDPGASSSETDNPVYGSIAEEIQVSEEDGAVRFSHDGKRYVCVFSDVGRGWTLAAYINESKVAGTLGFMILLMFIGALISYAMILGILLHIHRRRKNTNVADKQLRALAGIYASMYLFDLDHDTYAEVAGCAGEVRTLVESINGGAQKTLRMVMDTMTDERFKTSIYAFTNLSTLSDRLKGKKMIKREFIDNKNGRCCGRFVPVEWAEDGHLKTVLWMVEFLENRGMGS